MEIIMKKDNSQISSASQQSNIMGIKNSKSKTTIIALLIVLFVVIATLASVVYFMNKKDDNPSSSVSTGRGTVVTLDNKDEILADLNNKVSDGFYEIMMNVEWSFKDASTPSEDAYVANPTTNSNTVYFDVVVDSTGQTVYESPMIPVGYALQDIALKSDLAAGTYPCTLTYHLVDENSKDISTLAVGVTLNIES
ncbi:MAG: hypothetical protein HFH65_07730 [Lachnospiraceae bacterium]|nr:hypothetical protein [Lachnospiraceae bacterium]MCI9370190.1 hypothetical protein [Lachnospiraceae bacterium]